MKVRVGTSGFAYKEWKGRFYPEKLPEREMLPFYASVFGAVEINNTFYRMPSEETLAGWAAAVPRGFTFVLKAPRQITHVKRLAGAAEAVDHLIAVSETLAEARGPLLVQLPPFLKKDAARLAGFLDGVGERVRVALEFRHASWFDEEVYDVLRSRGAALCVADSEDVVVEAASLPATARFGYLRLRRLDYAEADLESWAARVAASPWEEAFVFFKHEDEARGPDQARRFAGQVEAAGARA